MARRKKHGKQKPKKKKKRSRSKGKVDQETPAKRPRKEVSGRQLSGSGQAANLASVIDSVSRWDVEWEQFSLLSEDTAALQLRLAVAAKYSELLA
jgi:hypothetical protein